MPLYTEDLEAQKYEVEKASIRWSCLSPIDTDETEVSLRWRAFETHQTVFERTRHSIAARICVAG